MHFSGRTWGTGRFPAHTSLLGLILREPGAEALGLVVFCALALNRLSLPVPAFYSFCHLPEDASLPACLSSQVRCMSPRCPHAEYISLSFPGISKGILRLRLLESKTLSEIAPAIPSLKHQKAPRYISLAKEGHRNCCRSWGSGGCCQQRGSVPGKAGQAWGRRSTCTLQSCAPRMGFCCSLQVKKPRVTASGFLYRSLIAQSALPWLSEGLFLRRMPAPWRCQGSVARERAVVLPGTRASALSVQRHRDPAFCFFWVSPSPLPFLTHGGGAWTSPGLTFLHRSSLQHRAFGRVMQEMHCYAGTCCSFRLLYFFFFFYTCIIPICCSE